MKWPILSLLLAGAAQAAEFAGPTNGLAWEHSQPEVVEEYRIYCDGSLVWTGPDMLVEMSELALQPGLHDCHVTAANPAAESGPSNNLPFRYVDQAPNAPTNLRVGG